MAVDLGGVVEIEGYFKWTDRFKGSLLKDSPYSLLGYMKSLLKKKCKFQMYDKMYDDEVTLSGFLDSVSGRNAGIYRDFLEGTNPKKERFVALYTITKRGARHHFEFYSASLFVIDDYSSNMTYFTLRGDKSFVDVFLSNLLNKYLAKMRKKGMIVKPTID